MLMLDQLERQWHTDTLCAAVMASQGAEVQIETWAEVQERFDEWLSGEPAPFDKETEKLRLLGLR